MVEALVAEFSVLLGLFDEKKKEQYRARHYLKAKVEKTENKHPWL